MAIVLTQLEIMRQYRNILARNPQNSMKVEEADALIAEIEEKSRFSEVQST